MTSVDRDDPILRQLSRLSTPAPEAARAERVIERCRETMTRRERRAKQRRGFARRVVEPVVVGGFSLVYAVALIYSVLHWRGWV
jgi:hypothetical protein